MLEGVSHPVNEDALKTNVMHIAYFVNQYPKVSHTFIRREIKALEAAGVRVSRIALRAAQAELVDAEDSEELKRTRYVLQAGAAEFVLAVVAALIGGPGQFFKAAAMAIRIGRRSDRGVALHLIYFLEACVLRRWALKSGYTHIHAHFGTNSVTVAMLAKLLGGAPYSFTAHGPEEFDMPVFLALGEKVRHASFVVAISSFCRSQLYRWSRLADWEKIHVVRCALDAQCFVRETQAVSSAPRLVCVGRLSAEKGQLFLIKALKLLADRGRKLDLVLAGDGPLRPEIEANIAELGLEKQVRITGWIDNRTVRQELLEARALVLPSFAEGLPVVIMESLAAGRPVIATYVAGIPELVENGRSGWLIPAGDIRALAEAMEAALAADSSDLSRMGELGRQRVAELHNADIEAARLAQLFREYATRGEPRPD